MFKDEWHKMQSNTLRQTILSNCETRLENDSSDELAINVKVRLLNCIDMVSSQAIYRQSCRAGFSVIKSEKPPGRPEHSDKKVAFEATCSMSMAGKGGGNKKYLTNLK